jgi:DNA-binding Lrp family transcriptional regulator
MHAWAINTAKEDIVKMPRVANAYTVFGKFDLIVEEEASDLAELARLVADKIRSVSGVVSTETYICYEPT